MIPQLIGAGLGAGLTLLGESQRVKEERKRIDAQKRALEEAKYTEEEKQNILSGINRRFNTSDLGQMNAAAYGLSGVLNSDVVRGLQSSRLLGQRTEALTQTESFIREANRNIDMQVGQLEGVSSSINVGNVALGGLAGYQIGESISKLGSKTTDTQTTTTPTSEVTNTAQTYNNQTYADVSSQLFPESSESLIQKKLARQRIPDVASIQPKTDLDSAFGGFEYTGATKFFNTNKAYNDLEPANIYSNQEISNIAPKPAFRKTIMALGDRNEKEVSVPSNRPSLRFEQSQLGDEEEYASSMMDLFSSRTKKKYSDFPDISRLFQIRLP